MRTLSDADVEAITQALAARLTAERGRLIDRAELARRLGISARQLFRLLRQGRLPAGLPVGGVERWKWDDVLRWLAKRRATKA